jgi:[ribosomal protein S18]-alanine N-acetyltransferase
MKPLEIKPTTNPSDFAVCAAMMAATDPWITLGMDQADCLKAFDGDYRQVYLVKNGEDLMGFVILQPQGTFKGYIQTICIDKVYGGKGYGTQVLQFCEEVILKYSPNIFICVSSFNHGAIKLYTDFGFELVGELPDFVKAGFTELLLRKTVGAIGGYQADRHKP